MNSKDKKREEKKTNGEKKRGSFWMKFFIILGLFVAALVCYNFTSAMFIIGKWFLGIILLLAGLTANIFIFIKGKKIAVMIGVVFLIGSMILILIFSFFGLGTTKEISPEEQQKILDNKKENIENLFNGIGNKDYPAFSRDLNDRMKEKYDKITFFSLYDELGKIISENCSKAAKSSTGDDVVLCEIESENKKTSWDMRFNDNSKIWGLYIENIYPNVTINIKSKNLTKTINILQNGVKTLLSSSDENYLFLVLDVSIKNNEDKSIKTHDFKFASGGYSFSLIQEEYEPAECSLIRKADFEIDEEKQGCLIFMIPEGYQEGIVTTI